MRKYSRVTLANNGLQPKEAIAAGALMINKLNLMRAHGVERAVVIGGSIAGLLAGRILTSHFERVTILERDRLPQDPTPCPGVPQSYHIHGLLNQGQRILEQLFPGLTASLIKKGQHQFYIPMHWKLNVTWD